MRYFLDISYDGTDYHGWQRQPQDASVEETIEKAFSVYLRTQVDITAAGRTDTGVHARYMIAHFDFPASFSDIELQDLTYRLNALLPDDISIQRIWQVNENAHARFDATSRTYEYWLTTRKNPFLHGKALWVKGDLDFDAMNKAAAHLIGTNDFTSFSKLHTDTKNNICTITKAEWSEHQDLEGLHLFTITANRFLRNMVRAIVGTLLMVGRHKIDEQDFKAIIERKDRAKAGTSADAYGLYLTRVEYPNSILE